jgi:hypothetical protein
MPIPPAPGRSGAAVGPVGLFWAVSGKCWSGKLFTPVTILPNDEKRQVLGCSTSCERRRRAWGRPQRRNLVIRGPTPGDPRVVAVLLPAGGRRRLVAMLEKCGMRFPPLGARRVAYEIRGDGPPLVAPAWWVSHLELDWQSAGFRRFWQGVADRYTLIRYDRLGVGMSDRTAPESDPTWRRFAGGCLCNRPTLS